MARSLTVFPPACGAAFRLGSICLAAMAGAVPASSRAEPGLLVADGRPADSETLAAGDQLLLEGRSGPFVFAGRQLDLDGFTGIVGYASEVAYVVVLDGTARDGRRRVGPGRILVIPPYGGEPAVERFDAGRLRESWGEASRGALPGAFARIEALARSQAAGLFFGRLRRTNFNVAAPGSAERELAGRTVRGAGEVQAIRFSGDGDPAAIERRVVERFLAGLAAGDAGAVAALMDPVPFGNTDLRGGAAEARQAMARALIGQRDWAALLRGADVAQAGEGNVWTVSGPGGGATLMLRPMGDFVFVRTIEVGGQS